MRHRRISKEPSQGNMLVTSRTGQTWSISGGVPQGRGLCPPSTPTTPQQTSDGQMEEEQTLHLRNHRQSSRSIQPEQ